MRARLLPILTSADSFAFQDINPSSSIPKKRVGKDLKKPVYIVTEVVSSYTHFQFPLIFQILQRWFCFFPCIS